MAMYVNVCKCTYLSLDHICLKYMSILPLHFELNTFDTVVNHNVS
jgi:hypothetical protein